ncbi:MAG: hypothetical protein ABWZ30_01100 [Jiangellaceae bacterium]
MRANDIKRGFKVNGVHVADVVRINHLRRIVFVDGTDVLVHMFQDFADVAASLHRLPAGDVPSRHQVTPRKVRASDKTWRGEDDGNRADQKIAKITAYDLTRNGLTRYPR